jgi:DNA-binding winged helix-turn-helix (wHTH) protein
MAIQTDKRAEGRSNPGSGQDGAFRLGEWLVDTATREIRHGDTVERLEPKVMRVLELLAARKGNVVSRYELESQVWTGMIVTDDAVTNTVIKLRRALGDKAREPRYVETIAKTGYRLIAPVEPVPADDRLPGADLAPEARAARDRPDARIDAGDARKPPPAEVSRASAPAQLRYSPYRPLLTAAGLIALLLLAWIEWRGFTSPRSTRRPARTRPRPGRWKRSAASTLTSGWT